MQIKVRLLTCSKQAMKIRRDSHDHKSEERAQQRIYRLEPAPMAKAQQWLSSRLTHWNMRLDAMEAYINQIESKE